MLKNSKVVSILSPFKVGQAGNLWNLPRSYATQFVDIPPSPPQKNVMLWYSSISNV